MYPSLQQLQKQLLDLPVNQRWQLVRVILESLQQDTTNLVSPQKNLSRLRGIARSTSESLVSDRDDYADYLTQKYR